MSADNPQTLNNTGAAVAVLLVGMLGGAIGALLLRPVPDANNSVLLVLLGALATNVTNICQFFFGSSAANRKKDDAINTLANTASAVQAASGPIPDKVIPVDAGEAVAVTAAPAKPDKVKP